MVNSAQRSILIAMLLCAATLSLGAAAQSYPSRPLRIVVPFAAGGAVDTIGRVLGQRLNVQMGQPVVVDNRPGANANLGPELVAHAQPDGYTLLLTANGLATSVTLFPKLSYDATRDLAAVGRVGYAPLVLVVPDAFPAKSLKELIALAKAQPGKLTYASAGNGSAPHLATEMLKIAADIDVLHVPYKGGAPALVDLLGRRISFMLLNPLEALPHVKSQRLRAITVAGSERIALFPDTPTTAEAGMPRFEASVWWAVFVPAGTPRAVVTKLNTELVRALGDAQVKDKLTQLGATLTPGTAEDAARFFKSEVEKWRTVIQRAGIHAD